MKKCVAYLRVSTENQVGEDKYGLDVQRKDIEVYAAKNDITIVDWFIEEGVSGGKLDRPELNRLLNGEVTNPPVEAVIVAKTDRLSRDIQMYYYIKLSLAKKNLELLSVQEDWGSYGMMSGMLEAMVVAFAEFERQMITTRTSNGRKAKAKTGGYAGGKAPLGYLVDDGKLVVDNETAEIVRGIFIGRENGQTYAQLSQELNNLGITTRTGSKWYPAQVGYIIKNKPLYEGMYKYSDDEWVQGVHESIL